MVSVWAPRGVGVLGVARDAGTVVRGVAAITVGLAGSDRPDTVLAIAVAPAPMVDMGVGTLVATAVEPAVGVLAEPPMAQLAMSCAIVSKMAKKTNRNGARRL